MSEPTSTSTYKVIGMACHNCAATVTEEVELLDGVTAVTVDIASGSLTVTSHGNLSPAAVRTAVEEAGYELAAP
ncbi:conserved domain protein [Streptomyces himastatinicus ATCC 53653]|uniref:Conserved domain protein n=1 Tax=Streptomyces himastatinicus ATCC 53653 TaxID=457427 RepID=D9WTT1_9ACTN|nr:heavy metal-associated domain-containing protein [Streptomyces himastatinicus]EFL22179.1 conserved domain protein [Streptomyces himastatinicus ATCC 53653]